MKLTELFDYYKFTLELENVISFSLKSESIGNIINHENKIDIAIKKSIKNKSEFLFKKPEKPDYVIREAEKLLDFFNTTSIIEKTENYAKKNYKKKLKDELYKESVEFSFGETNLYQYSIFINFFNEKYNVNSNIFRPMFIISFPQIDKDFKNVSPNIIFEQIKRFLLVDYDHSIDEMPLNQPTMILNPQIIEPYSSFNLGYEDFTSKDIEDAKNAVKTFIDSSKLPIDDTKYFVNRMYLCAFNQNMTQALIRTYESIKKDGANSLLKKYFSIHPDKGHSAQSSHIDSATVLTSLDELNAHHKHYGAFDNKNYLAQTQRQALSCYLSNKEILVPVNGAPGTGKTSLLRAIAGDYIVKASLESYNVFKASGVIKFQTPVMCTSTNNQALYNISEGIIDGFNDNKDASGNDILYSRWINYIEKLVDDDQGASSTNNNLGDDIDDEDNSETETKYADIKEFDFRKTLLVPIIKSKKGKDKIYELSKSKIPAILNDIAKQSDYFIEKFEEKYGQIYTGTKYEKLKLFSKYLHDAIIANIGEINSSITEKVDTESIEQLGKAEILFVEQSINNHILISEIKKAMLGIKTSAKDIYTKTVQLEKLQLKVGELKLEKTSFDKQLLEIESSASSLADNIGDNEQIVSEISAALENTASIKSMLDVNRFFEDNLQKFLHIILIKNIQNMITLRNKAIDDLDKQLDGLNSQIISCNNKIESTSTKIYEADMRLARYQEYLLNPDSAPDYEEISLKIAEQLKKDSEFNLKKELLTKIAEIDKQSSWLERLFNKKKTNADKDALASLYENRISELALDYEIQKQTKVKCGKEVEDNCQTMINKISSEKSELDSMQFDNHQRLSAFELQHSELIASKIHLENYIDDIICEINTLCEKAIAEKCETNKNLETEIQKLLNIKQSVSEKLESNSEAIVSFSNDYNNIFDEIGLQKFTLEQIKNLSSHHEAYYQLSELKDFLEHKENSLDKNQRTENFYLALHLLEALFFLRNEVDSNRSSNTVKCPFCADGALIKDNFKNHTCSNQTCKHSFKVSNPNNQKIISDLSDVEIEHILRNQDVALNGKYYSCTSNITPNGNYINITASTMPSEINNIFEKILPIFPIVATTCNSFGSVVRGKRNDGSTNIQKDIFDFMLVDEAGTILPSKMCIFQAAKKAMLFGDTKQLKPVFPYKKNVEEKLLEKFISNRDEIKHLSFNFSCADKMPQNNNGAGEISIRLVNNAMDVCNNAVSYYLPYNSSKLDGDIWLKEHYRCDINIAQIANKLTYENEMVICTKNDGILIFEECGGKKEQSNTNTTEASAIKEFLLAKRVAIETYFRETLGKDKWDYEANIGVITPFTNQEVLLQKELASAGLGSIKVGTVHKYQGSARDIIIFSTVYNEGDSNTKNFFFNRGDSDMINVAVTRAKKVFICFGNSKILNQNGTHSGVMVTDMLQYQSNIFSRS